MVVVQRVGLGGVGAFELTVQDGGMGRRMGIKNGRKFPIRVSEEWFHFDRIHLMTVTRF